MRRLFLPIALLLPLALGGCEALPAIGLGLAGMAAPFVLGTAQSYGEQVQGGIEAADDYRKEMVQRRRDYRALCQADVYAERAFYLQEAARAKTSNEAAALFAQARRVLAQTYPSLEETVTPLGERDMGICGASVLMASPEAPPITDEEWKAAGADPVKPE